MCFLYPYSRIGYREYSTCAVSLPVDTYLTTGRGIPHRVRNQIGERALNLELRAKQVKTRGSLHQDFVASSRKRFGILA